MHGGLALGIFEFTFLSFLSSMGVLDALGLRSKLLGGWMGRWPGR